METFPELMFSLAVEIEDYDEGAGEFFVQFVKASC